MKRIGLALGAGGAKGLCHIAFIEALDEMGYKPSIISGTSIGAIIGGAYASGMTAEEIKQILGNVNFLNISKIMVLSIWSNSGMLKGKGVEEMLRKHIPVQTFEDLKIPFKAVATDFWNRNEVILDSGDLITALRASMSMPAILKPVVINDRVLIDGGAVNPLPYDIIRKDCDLLIAIDVSGEKIPSVNKSKPKMIESIMSTFQIMQTSIVNSKMKISKPDIYIKPELKNIRVLELFKYDEIMDAVKDDVKHFKKEVKKKMKRFKIL